MKMRFYKFISAFTAVIMTMLIVLPAVVLADANISMTTSDSSVDIADDIEIKVTIDADEQIGTYYVELEYDSSRMRYVNGAESEQDGILTLTGTGMKDSVEYDLKFTGAAGGEAGIIVRDMLVNDSAGNAMASTASSMLEIVVSGQTDKSASFTQKLEEEKDIIDSDLPLAGSIHDSDGNTYFVVDLTRTTPDTLKFEFDTTEETLEGQTVTFATDKDGVLRILPLMDSNDNVSLYAVNGDVFYPMIEHTTGQGTRYYYVGLDACTSIPQKLAYDTEMWEYVVYGVTADGKGGFYLIDEKGNFDYYTILNASTLTTTGWMARVFTGSVIPWERYLIVAAVVLISVIILCIALHYLLRGHKKKKVRLAAESQYDFYLTEPVGVDEDIDDIDVIRKSKDIEKEINVGKRNENAEEISLDDIVLTDEDVPQGVSVRNISESGTNSVSTSESGITPDSIENTIRIDKTAITEKLGENSAFSGKAQKRPD